MKTSGYYLLAVVTLTTAVLIFKLLAHSDQSDIQLNLHDLPYIEEYPLKIQQRLNSFHLISSSPEQYLFDPRFGPVATLKSFNRELGASHSFRVPFSWQDWAELSPLHSCEEVKTQYDVDLTCKGVLNACDLQMSAEARRAVAAASLVEMYPERILYVGDDSSVSFKTQRGRLSTENVPISFPKEFAEALRLMNDSLHPMFDSSTLLNNGQFENLIDLEVNDFTFGPSRIFRLMEVITQESYHKEYKYFHEALVVDNDGTHYDWRFFNRIITDDVERGLILHRVAKAWFAFAEATEVLSWLSHGSLLGYYWNGMVMPFDNDIDISITLKSLIILIKYNQTLIVDGKAANNDNHSYGIGSYFLDVNPNYLNRAKSDNNVIDARFIDIHTGLYIDITALTSSLSKGFRRCSMTDFGQEFNMLLDASYTDITALATVDQGQYGKQLDNKLAGLINSLGIFNCKNNHFYSLQDLSPLKQVQFEGSKAWIPSNTISILNREYNKPLHKYFFGGYIYRKPLRLWISTKDCPRKMPDEDCKQQKGIHRLYTSTKNYTHGHKNAVVAPQLLIKHDPWLLKHAAAVALSITSI